MIPQKFVEELKSKINILDVASSYFDIEKSGSVYQAYCLHGDKNTKSLTFFPETNTFHCFGCGAGSKQVTDGSDIVSFMMWVEKCNFPEAVEKLAALGGVEVPQKDLNAEEKKRQTMLFKTLQENRQYYNTLRGNEEMLKYLWGRGIGNMEIEKWRIGYVGKDDVTKAAGRIAFAIMDSWGDTVGFSYRNMESYIPSADNPDTGPKYINSPKSALFDKGAILYGLNFIKKMIRERDYVVIVEGFGDAIIGQKYDCPFVGLMGTSLTQAHLDLLSLYTKNIYVWFDGDAGGLNASLRHIDALRSRGFLVKVIYTPNNDPDDVIQGVGSDLEEWIMDNAILAGQFQINLIMNKHNSAMTEQKIKTVSLIKNLLAGISDGHEKEIYCNQVAEHLGVDPITLRR
jgi:DNA primase